MGFLANFLSFEKPMGETLTRILYYLGILGVIWFALRRIWFWITYLNNDWDTALWGIIKTPIGAVISILVLRVLAEFVLAQFRMDKSLDQQAKGKAAVADKTKS
ncbi:MAG: hypothetical protein Hens3KO_15240 [Henriciella sp.]